jgi:hypothetical protein
MPKLHRCCVSHCPGYPWAASGTMPHPCKPYRWALVYDSPDDPHTHVVLTAETEIEVIRAKRWLGDRPHYHVRYV